MIPISPAEIRAILAVTDGLSIHRESVVIPLAREGDGGVRLLTPAKLEIIAPEMDFPGWLDGLGSLIQGVDLKGLKRAEPDD